MDGSPVNPPQVSVMSTFLWKLFLVFGWCGPSNGQATAALEAQCVYYIQLGKEASLPHLGRSCFSEGRLQVVNIPGRKPCIPGGKLCIVERKLWWAFSAQTVHVHTEIQGRLWHSYELWHSHRAETLVLDMPTHTSTAHTHSGLITLRPSSMLSSGDTGKKEKASLREEIGINQTDECVWLLPFHIYFSKVRFHPVKSSYLQAATFTPSGRQSLCPEDQDLNKAWEWGREVSLSQGCSH